ncbi:DUF4365 domain-containing protein [Lysinibacillus fusiformis]|uniref:DUF4365 domain-containing protein n=1 Tax=Lysinibacillus fusiformis TaxID=28031 RepID=UPI000891261B|nr:DUF4365 domain-containing protein [Lysinibacillus fusiformis]SCX63530.1 protein of unknown function [Lysinibacillus fusiformis]SDB46387.1 protein of unknown function [Lysinibacillus fusiformis]SFI73610.1 protein of unknown function [Lysinibacillus fusiformis]SFT15985.1 protein of unknown function [Lysinibacillus fusiformis]
MDSYTGRNILPKILESFHQEIKSIQELERIISQGRLFLVRKEFKMDFGVDLRLELLLEENNASNFKIDVQMKNVKKAKRFNNDGSYSYQIKISTLNYLLNSINSLFIIYLEDRDIFLWEWCYTIRKYIEDNNVNIDTQKSISYRFNKTLNEHELQKIFNEVKTKYEKILSVDKNSKLKNIKQNSSDLNISVDSIVTKYNLRIIYDYLVNKKQLGMLAVLTLYDIDELLYALENGIMTTRLAQGIKRIFDIDLQYLNGTTKIDEVFIFSLEDSYEE